ncbi:zinc-binding dehydrogenase [Halococcus sp. IIIV-5B]|uniref:zinc-binding dehydrogenase n=1 Tax=Halococcus sp. IIIV-5B TaxID=2321230 RepID=UPI000E766D66|nr:zinc-binding dehydrogenase [Halococcus sp. IIIV-5B]RJT07879.1 NADPH:quinone reductase [Halococcus sp. IIIV-5B]
MKAAHITQYGEPETALEIVDVDKPEPGPDEVRIQVERVALNHLDVFARRGHPSDDDDFPKRTGCDIAGTVDTVGSEADGEWEGTNVVVYPGVSCGDCEYCLMGEQTMCSQYEIIGEDRPGGLAEYVVVPERCIEALPTALDFETAAAVPIAFTTAWRMMITTGGLRPAESALVLGASGGVGNAALQIANRVGATVYATTSTERKAARLRQWADEVIDYTETPFTDTVAELTDGRGVDIVADHVGESTWQESIDSLAMGGRMVICGATSGADPDIDIRSVYQAHRQIRGAPMGNRVEFRDVLSLVARNELVPQVDCTLPLEDIAAGHRTIENREVIGKIIIDPTTP